MRMSRHTSADIRTSVGSILTPPGAYCAQVLNGRAREKEYREAITAQMCMQLSLTAIKMMHMT